jgi:hypothetical protein
MVNYVNRIRFSKKYKTIHISLKTTMVELNLKGYIRKHGEEK